MISREFVSIEVVYLGTIYPLQYRPARENRRISSSSRSVEKNVKEILDVGCCCCLGQLLDVLLFLLLGLTADETR